MKKTFEDLIFEETDGQSDGWQTTYLFSDVLKLMKLIRKKTLDECKDIYESFHLAVNATDTILNLDKNSIEL